MNRLTAKNWLLISPVMILIGVISIGFYRWASEPRYQGRTAWYWEAQLASTNLTLQVQAMGAINRTNVEAIPFLVRIIQSGPPPRERLHEFLFLKIRPRLPSALAVRIPLPQHEHRWTRSMALSSLGRMGTNALPALPALTKALDDKEIWVRGSVAEAIARIGPNASAAIPALVRSLADWDLSVRLAAVQALESIGELSPGVISAIIQLLRDPKSRIRAPSVDLRRSSVRVLGRPGMSNPSAIEMITELLWDSAAVVALEAAKTLWRTQRCPETIVPALAELAQKSEAEHAFEAVLLLGQVAGQSESAVPPLVAALKHANERVRGTAARVLGNLGRTAKPALSSLTNARNDPYSNVRDAAELALQKINADIKSNAGPVKP